MNRFFIHANQRNFRITETMIEIQYILHVGNKLSVLLWGNYPALPLVRF
jgi:hypothetical protein